MSAAADSSEMILVGRIGAAHGVRGWLRVKSYTDPPANLAHYRPLWLKTRSGWEPLDSVDLKDESRPGRPRLLLRLPGVSDRNAAELQRGLELGMRAADLPDAGTDSYYWRDLVGMSALTPSGELLGSVREVLDTPAHSVLVLDVAPDLAKSLQLEPPEVLVPFVNEFTQAVDLEEKTIVIDWPEVFQAEVP